ncbi:MAG: uroporphyrinogen-III C-methyltransferase [Parvibaculum sp.]
MTQNLKRDAQVSFAGSGPGDPELLTMRTVRRLREADVVLHDALVTQEILALAPGRKIDVGKRAGRHSMSQPQICRLLVRLARTGKNIVRLKGGDPVIFGRLDEEIAVLDAAGISFEIVPGITAASAAAAAAGLSLTKRGVARRVQFVTGHTENGDPFDPVSAGLADPSVSSVIYMARGAAAAIAGGLLRAGWSPETSVLVVANASRRDELKIGTSLLYLEHSVAALPRDMPLVLMLGAVAASPHYRSQCAGPAVPSTDIAAW